MIVDDIKRWVTNLVAMTLPDEPLRGLDTFPVQPPLPSANDGPPEDFDG